MGLNDNYENLRNQIHVLDPLPSVHKAYSMALGVEKQREVLIKFSVPTKVSAMMVKTSNNNFQNKRPFPSKCKNNDSKNKSNGDRLCFKIPGYPDWFKELKDKRKTTKYNSTHMASFQEHNPLDMNTSTSNEGNNESMNQLFQQFSQIMKANQQSEPNLANFSHLVDLQIM
ncbi:hypothetical protein LXL04_028576 [Taraxacum kok-saghyz]